MAYLNQQLKTAIEKQDEDAMEQLLECGADPNAFLSGEDIAPIHLGPGMSKSITALLLKYGGDPNLRTSDGITPLHIAATWGNKSIVKLLLHSGANVYIRDDEGFTPLDMAKKYEHEKCEIILKQHLHILESQMNNKQKVRQKPPLSTKTETNSKRIIDNNRNVDVNQNFSIDPEYRSSRVKRENLRHSIYRKEIQNQIDHLCENEDDFHIDVTSPDHPCINVTPKRQCHFSSPKHIRAYSEPVTENTSTPIRPRRSLYTTNVQHKIDRLTGSGKNVGIDVTSPDHPELFFTPTAKSPLNYHEKICSETPINSHKTNVMVSKLPDSSSSESDLYVTVNEASVDHRNKEISSILDVDEMKHSMTHKIEQLRNCLNKLDTQKPFITDEDKLYCRSKEAYSNNDFSSGKQKNRKVHGQNPDVDVKFTMELPPKMVLDEKKIKKIEHSKPYTIEMNLGQKHKKSQGKNSKREPIIDIQIQPKGESHMKYKVRNQDEADIQINSKSKSQESYKRKVDLKSPEIQEKHNSRVRSKSAHENICFQAEQDSKLRGKNKNGRYRQETYPGERISTVNLTHKNQRGGERYDYNDVVDPSVLITHDSRNHVKSNGHSEKAYVIKSSTENVPPSSYSHVTSRNYKPKLPFQKQELPHCSNMTEEKMITRSHVQHNERVSNFSRERKIIPEKSSYTGCRKEPLIFPTQKNPQPIKRKDLSHPQQKKVFLKESSESKYLNCNSIPENHFFRQKGCMVINEKPKVDAVQKIVSQKVVHAPLDKRATKFPDSEVHAESFLPNTDSQKAQFSNKIRRSTSSATSTDTYYTCSSQLDTDDFFSCENGQESSSEDFLTFPTDEDKRPVPSFFEELTEVLGSKDSSYLREFEFNENELIHALSEFNLREPNASALTETLFNALSSIRKSNDKEIESSDRSLVGTNQFRNTQAEKRKQDNTLYRTGSLLHHASAIDRDNSHIRRQARITARSSSLPRESLNAADGQYEEFETAIEEVLLSRSASEFKSQFSNPIMSESNSFLQTSSVPNHSAAVSPPSLKSESNTSDTFFLVCVPSADNKFDTPQRSAHISSCDEVDHQYGGSLHHERDKNNSLNPVKPDLFHSCIDNENMRSKIKDDNSPYASNFSKVLSELKQKTDVKALQSQQKTCYRWQPPENVMSSSYTDDSFLNGNERDPKSKELKKKVGLELKNHPLVKSQKSAIEKSFDYHDHSAQDEDLHIKQNEQSRLDAGLEDDEFNETRLKHILMGKDLDNCRQPQRKKPNSLRQNISKQKSFSKYDTKNPHFKSVQNECMKICKQPDTRKISEKNQSSYYAGFDASYNPSQSKDDSVYHSCYHSLKKASGNSREADDSDDSLKLEKSCYTSLHKEGSTDMGQSQYVSYCRDKSLDTERSCYTSFHRKGSSEVDQSCYNSVHTEVPPHMDQSCYFSSCQESYPDADRSYTSIDSEDFSDEDKSHYVSVHRDDFPDADKSHYVSVRRDHISNADKSHYVSVRRDDISDANKSHYASVRRDDFPDANKSHYVSVRRDDFPDADKSHYVSVRRDDISDADKSHYVSVLRDDFPDANKSHYVSVRRDDFPDADESHYVSVRRDDISDADKSHYVSVQTDDSSDADKCHYMSVLGNREHLPDADKSHYVSGHGEDIPDTDKSHYVSVCREGSLEINPSSSAFIHKKSIPVNFKALSTKSSRIPMLINGQLQKQQKVHDFISNTEHVTLQKRYISPPSSCQYDKSLYVSAEEKDSFFTQNGQSKSNVKSVDDNVTSSSHWQYLSTKSSAHNRSVTWQNPISTFDQIDAALVDSTDESISWSPKQKGHSPQTIPLTSTSASEEITSESMSSDEFKRCLERKKLLTPEERTTLWVNGIYKSNLQEYFDADMSSILPVLNSNTSSSDTGKEMKCGATAANMTNHRYIEPSAPPQSEINCDNFRCIPTAPPDISNIAVAGISGDKVNELSSSDYVSLHPSLYPSLVEPCQNSVSKKYSGSQCKGNNGGNNSELHAASTSAAYVSFDSEPEPTANVHCSPQTIQNTPHFTGKVSKMSSIKPVPFQDASDKSYLMGVNTVNKLHQTAKSISTQTPVLRIPPDPPNKSKSLPAAFGMTTQNKKLNKEKLPQKGWAKLKKIFTGKKIHGKIGNKAFISVDSRQSFLPNLSELSPPSTDTSGTQTDPDIFYEPTLKHLEIIKSDEVSLSVNFSENLSDYSEKYPSSVLPNIAEYLEQATRIDSLEICSSSGATSGSMERLLSPYQEDSNEDDDIDEVDHVESNTYPVNPCDNQEFKDNSQPLSTETKIYGETYKTKLAQGDKRRKSNNIEFLHTDPEERVQFIERQISAENQNGDQSDDSESTEIYDWKSFSKSFNDCDNLPQTENRSFYWRTCGDKPDDVKTNVKKSKKPLTDLGCLSDVQFRQTLIDHGLSNPGPVTKGTRQLYLKRLKNQSGQQTLACTQSSPDYNAELCRAFNEQIDWTEMVELEEKMIKKFDNSKNSQKWREGNEKSSFTYLLLDPRVTRNLPCRASKMDDTLETFRTFVKAIFYIGKGKRNRPYAHLYEAIKYSQGNSTKVNEKISHINDIWKNGYGVVSLHCFQNVIPVEAYSREACMVDAIGCGNLTNKKRGDFYGLTSTWCLKLKRRMGVYFLHKALRIFMAEGERQIYLTDL